ncbi:glycosyltransferase family 2 protein [Corynebacterium glucuronolyticum]|uniref:Glycosyltransferase family 2 protein n=1 Tax=Corynebacterium glucuronolyticum TaxID=39791 RepID=A0A7T4EFQ8_9CORY|nr:glycosyltransferase family 2 protein [Corynebacterium glucuronolyticum]EEI28197.1 glycosyltransferase, group 2 family protein [Corynebacterium glucuronolyticum ATCC 51867]QQB46558.1 glycosyltransferase family 2 protein [Corynebacterium glucuronolyticum]QRO81829.1 glycosyltransferase family 2 protein [Corynebacterium glucuronolyticum]WKD62645.1 Undecaprenyl-phosphate 4-deoxy-4-formamido-L-arabinose transferase [Corynebacterium glucuronolyticum DSM 44120]SMB78028.1 Glycosyltransferases involv
MQNQDTWLIIPCFNEGTVIGDVIRHARETFPNIVAVNDGSSDNSAEEIHKAGAHLVNHPVNLGQGAAIQTGVEYARSQPGAQYFVTFDADGQHQVKDVVSMLDRLRNEDVDIIVGTRFGRPRKEDDQVPWIKRLVLKTVVLLSSRTRKLGLTDAHNGLRVFNKKVADELNIRMNGMSHASEFVAQMDERGWRVSEQPVDILYTEYSMSKGQSLINGVNILADGFIARRLK